MAESKSGASIESVILQALSSADAIEDSWVFADANGFAHTEVVGVIKSLLGDSYILGELLVRELLELTDEAQAAIDNGSPECRVLNLVPAEGISLADLNAAGAAALGKSFKAGFGTCMKNKWLVNDRQTKTVTRAVEDAPADALVELLQKAKASGAAELSASDLKGLKRRKMVLTVKRKSYKLTKGARYAPVRVRAAADLTKEMLDSGAWQTQEFKAYNFRSLGAPINGGYLHPLLKVRAEFRKILLEMGFEEMPTNRFVESSFWNFDALFQPQQHPARDAHDTFFISKPAATLEVPEDYLQRVKATHEDGGDTGSTGYHYNWSREESMKNILRTHTTAISSQMLYQIGQSISTEGFKPRKFFSIDRVFRNETMDATHLAEFHQVEGVVMDRNLSLGDLIGVIKLFFEKIGITDVRFKPAYNPYTEPSMEIFAFHPDLNCWTEVGNSGVFRPEMLLPMGLPPDVNVIAWGLSLERPTMIKYRIDNIRDLFGHKIDLNTTKTAPISRYF